MITSLFSCKSEKTTYIYGTSEFEQRSNQLRYTLNDAVDIYLQHLFSIKTTENLEFYIRILYDDNYIFSTSFFDPKEDKCNLSGYWVNGETGEIKEITTKEYAKIKPTPISLSFEITRSVFDNNGKSYFNKKE